MGPPAPPRPQSPEQPMLARSLRELARVPALVRGADLLREWHEKAVMSDSGIACIYAAALWIVFCTLCAASWVASTARAMNSKIMKIRPIGTGGCILLCTSRCNFRQNHFCYTYNNQSHPQDSSSSAWTTS